VAQITPAEIAKAAHELYPGKTTAWHVRAVYTPTNAVLAKADEAGLCTWRHVKPPVVKRPPIRAASDGHITALLPHCNPRLAGLVLFLTFTGSRVSEACRLEWAHVDFERREALLTITKNGKPRKVALADAVLHALRRLAEDAPGAGPVFGYADRWSARNAIVRASRRAGVEYMSSHKLGRHAFAARLLRDGHSLPVVTAAGGWASSSMVSQVYGHLEQSHVDDAVRKAALALPKP
jgi:integrase